MSPTRPPAPPDSFSAPAPAPAPAPRAVRLRRVQANGYLDLAGVHALIERRVAALFAEHGLVGITPQQSNVLLVLFQEKRAMTAREVARSLEVSEVTVGRFVKALCQNGWVERRTCPGDARALLIEPTLAARRAFPVFCHVSNVLLDEAFRGFEPEEIERQGGFLHRVRANLAGASHPAGAESCDGGGEREPGPFEGRGGLRVAEGGEGP